MNPLEDFIFRFALSLIFFGITFLGAFALGFYFGKKEK